MRKGATYCIYNIQKENIKIPRKILKTLHLLRVNLAHKSLCFGGLRGLGSVCTVPSLLFVCR